MPRKIRFIVVCVKWFDTQCGNTYFSNRITRCSDGKTITTPYEYGYGGTYQTAALKTMLKAGWFRNIKRKTKEGQFKPYTEDNVCLLERENNYPIYWYERKGLKRECKDNGEL